ncbi:hypothetical protein ETAA8_34030 [Anatilimnocola aggregata]|uniref:FecR protein domain-containing protein n=1 Tax=Anatilimnocola aggregata TaxID=2528021 RepID=A0A517YDJ2_9BACT|nr:hypothetical protein [Anatilimnocola aggregata]QDU28303.1 hypothetical protein ETAA8_34030 [Anatilimnocola aggregata]
MTVASPFSVKRYRAVALALLFSVHWLPASAADPIKAEAATVAVATEATFAPEIAEDPAFSRYLDLLMVGRAWDKLDAALLADCALQLAEGERVLHRTHHAITAEQLLALATKIAADKRDLATLERLAKACEAAKNTAALEKITFARKLAGQSRGAEPAASVSALDTNPKQLIIYQKALKGLRAADILGDAKYLDQLDADLKSKQGPLKDLTSQQRDNLQKLVGKSRAALPTADNQALVGTLSKLKASSRGFGCRFGSLFGGMSFFGDDDFEEEEYEEEFVTPHPVVRPVTPQPAPQPPLPQWLIGAWQLMDGRTGGATFVEFTPDGKFITIDTAQTAQGVQETGRSTASARYSTNGLQLGDKLFQVSSSTPGILMLTLNGTAVQIKRVDQPAAAPGGGGQPNAPGQPNPGPGGNNPRPGVIKLRPQVPGGPVVANQLPASMQGTWFEVTRNRLGDEILIRYDFNADGTYDLQQFAVSEDGEVDLNSPIAQLSKKVPAAQRTIAFANGQLTLGAGQRFAEGPMTATVTTDSNGEPALGLGNSGRVLTRSP